MSADQRKVVVVTGSSGFLGSAVVEMLAEKYRVVGFDRGVSSHPPAVAECVCEFAIVAIKYSGWKVAPLSTERIP